MTIIIQIENDFSKFSGTRDDLKVDPSLSGEKFFPKSLKTL